MTRFGACRRLLRNGRPAFHLLGRNSLKVCATPPMT
jgi:hypothetical protein